MSLSLRKQGELYRKLDSLAREFQHWRDRSEKDGQFEKHHTQIRRVTFQLEGLQKATRRELDDLGRDGARGVLARARALEERILEVHRIWEFFRSKFVLRSVDWFSPFLVAADEFAWECYSAARDRYAAVPSRRDELKEPPLVFFNGGASPFTKPRNYTFQAEQVDGASAMTAESSAVLRELPIPVIGVPWFQIQHLPEALVVGHEVGHDVERDFGLEPRLVSLLEASGVAAERLPAWKSWLRETFADLYGVLATGPAFVATLIDFLATDAAQTAAAVRKSPRWGTYPPDYLRVLVSLCALEVLGFTKQSADLRAQLETAYGKEHGMKTFEPDIRPVVTAIFNGPYPEFGGVKLTEVLCFDHNDRAQAEQDCKELLKGNDSTAYNVRTLFAAARLAYDTNTQLYESNKVHQKVLEKVSMLRQSGVRAARPGDEALTEEEKKARRKAQDEHDLDAGAKLLAELTAARKPGTRKRSKKPLRAVIQ